MGHGKRLGMPGRGCGHREGAVDPGQGLGRPGRDWRGAVPSEKYQGINH